jgi:uncharacterized membrane protein
MSKEKTKKIGTIILCILIIGIGIWAIIQPDLMNGVNPSGRRGLIKRIIIWAWGMPGGIIACIFGALGIYGHFLPDDDKKSEITTKNDSNS